LGTSLASGTIMTYETGVAAVSAELGEAVFAAEWDVGRHLTLEQARLEADQTAASVPPPSTPAHDIDDRHGLTPREFDVLCLVATGLSDREIAAALVISPQTVSTHVGNILAKLGVGSRTAAAAYAFQHRIIPLHLPNNT
jgi:DNA-binding NarL/FixJ family response regulator